MSQQKLTSIALFTGLLSGALASLFLLSLEWVTTFRQEHPGVLWGLPLFGSLFGLILKRIPHHINQGVPYILSELENHKAHVSPLMTPFIFLSSLGTHLFGGSAGREGVGVIMGASAAHLFPRALEDYSELRPYLIYAGIGAGFSSIFGTPLAAVIFAFELYSFKHVKQIPLLLCTAGASFSALVIPHYFGPIHQRFSVTFTYDSELLLYILIGTLAAGVGGNIFYWGIKWYTKLISIVVPKVETKLFVGSLLILALVSLTEGYRYIGIGTDLIAQSFENEMSIDDFALKCSLTIMTLSIGFKGGEVTPLFCMGSTLSNSIAVLFSMKNFGLSSSLGMVSLFGAVSGTPLASAVMGAELFGWQVGLLCLITCVLARRFMGERSIYRH